MIKRPQYNSVTANISAVVILGTLFVIICIAALLLRSYMVTHRAYTLDGLLASGVALAYILFTSWLLRKNRYRVVAYLLVLFYMLTASVIVFVWGINTPIGPLTFALVIVLTAILLTARSALIAALLAGLILAGVQAAASLDWHRPDSSWMVNQSTFGDVAAYSSVFIMIALISWLYNREMERSLAQVRRAEAKLTQQKMMLKSQVKDRTKELRQVQLEEMRHMYQFAELGQLGVTLLHDLADHLTTLNLEIDDMESKKGSKPVARARQITQYLEDIVDHTRQRLGGRTQKQTFDVVRLINETIDFLYHKAKKLGVEIVWQPPEDNVVYVGDADSLSQILAIIISNAIDAYESLPTSDEHRVTVTLEQNNKQVVIRVSNGGKVISITERKRLFKLQHSTKKSGLGLGLYIAKQIVEMQFSGTIALNHRSSRTEFIIKLPKNDEG